MGIKSWLAAGALAVAALAGASPAGATIYIGVQTSSFNGGAVTQVASGASTAAVSGASYGVFTVNNISGTVGVYPDLFNSNALDQISSEGAGVLHVFITETGITNPAGVTSLVSSLTSNTLTNGWTVTESTFYDAANGIFTTVSPLANQLFTAIGTSVQSDAATLGPNAYSVTEEFTINAPGAGTANSTIDVAAVPEPGTWLLMILGVFGVGATMRKQRDERSLGAARA